MPAMEHDLQKLLERVVDDPLKAKCKLCKSTLTADSNSLKRVLGTTFYSVKLWISVTREEHQEDAITATEIKPGFFVEHNIPFNTAAHLTDLLKSNFPKKSEIK